VKGLISATHNQLLILADFICLVNVKDAFGDAILEYFIDLFDISRQESAQRILPGINFGDNDRLLSFLFC